MTCSAPRRQKLLDFLRAEDVAGRGFPSKEVIAAHMEWRDTDYVTAALTELSGFGYVDRVWVRTKKNGSRLDFRLRRAG